MEHSIEDSADYQARKAQIQSLVFQTFNYAANKFNDHPSAENWTRLEEAMYARQSFLAIPVSVIEVAYTTELGKIVSYLASFQKNKG